MADWIRFRDTLVNTSRVDKIVVREREHKGEPVHVLAFKRSELKADGSIVTVAAHTELIHRDEDIDKILSYLVDAINAGPDLLSESSDDSN